MDGAVQEVAPGALSKTCARVGAATALIHSFKQEERSGLVDVKAVSTETEGSLSDREEAAAAEKREKIKKRV
jgi:hypothetical protein